MQHWQQTQLTDTHSCGPVEVENVSSVGGGTATTNVNLHGQLDEAREEKCIRFRSEILRRSERHVRQ